MVYCSGQKHAALSKWRLGVIEVVPGGPTRATPIARTTGRGADRGVNQPTSTLVERIAEGWYTG